MELWDLYDAERKPLGRTHVRGEQFGEGEYYVCCEIWVKNAEGSFLITKRHPDKKAGNQWEFVGGGTVSGETTKQSAVRELFEETGLQVLEEELELMTTFTHKNYFQDIFLLKKDVDVKSLVLQADETVDAKMASEAEIQRMIDDGEMVYSVGIRFGLFKDKAEMM